MVKTRKFHVSLECWWDFPLATPGDFLPAPPHQREERQEQAPSLLPWLTDSPDSDSSVTARGPEVASHSSLFRGASLRVPHSGLCCHRFLPGKNTGNLYLLITQGLQRTEALAFSSKSLSCCCKSLLPSSKVTPFKVAAPSV